MAASYLEAVLICYKILYIRKMNFYLCFMISYEHDVLYVIPAIRCYLITVLDSQLSLLNNTICS